LIQTSDNAIFLHTKTQCMRNPKLNHR